MKKSRKEKKYLKQMQKDMAKACGMKRKKLFWKDTPKSGASIAIDYLKAREKGWIKFLRKELEKDFKEKYPQFKDLTFKWDNLDEVFR